MSERWLPVPGFEGLYEVSDLGRIKSLARVVVYRNGRQESVTEKIRKTPLVCGYSSLFLSKGGTKTFFYVHILVALVFIGRRPEGEEVAHWDGDRSNPSLSNLRYATPVENDADKIAHGTRPNGERNGHARLTDAQVLEIRNRANDRLIDLSREFGVGPRAIAKIIKRTNWRHLP